MLCDITNRIRKIKKNILKQKENRKHLYFEVHLVEHCNLRCASCTHFAAIASLEYLDEAILINDFTRMKELFGERYPFYIRLMGGEPLLHPNINNLILKSREILPMARIELVTNGLLLSQMPDSFFQILAEKEIIVYISRYPIEFDYQQLFDLLDSWQIAYVRNDHSKKTEFGKLPLSLNEKHDVREAFYHCIHANQEHNLSHGKIYTCMYAANIRHFNNRFGTSLPENNGIDIYKIQSARQLRKKLKQPTPLCAHCRPQDDKMFPWHRSEGKITEWS